MLRKVLPIFPSRNGLYLNNHCPFDNLIALCGAHWRVAQSWVAVWWAGILVTGSRQMFCVPACEMLLLDAIRWRQGRDRGEEFVLTALSMLNLVLERHTDTTKGSSYRGSEQRPPRMRTNPRYLLRVYYTGVGHHHFCLPETQRQVGEWGSFIAKKKKRLPFCPEGGCRPGEAGGG